MKWLLRVALLCGLLPLIVGVGAMVGYWLVGWDFLGAGFLAIFAGCLLFLFGLASLIVYWTLSRKRQLRISRWSWVALLILVLNVPIGYGCWQVALDALWAELMSDKD
jgi:hypothetical protein